ncbi:MAG: hypothetical protein H0W68_09670 [Gemmatimonadaceae bacterium]|nr:hypothetical protein [Gemmatimonadaceae bacterium]
MSVEYTFVFADLAGYTAMTEAHGDDDAAQIATRFHEPARACLPAETRLVKTIRDAVMLVSPSIKDAIATTPRSNARSRRSPRFQRFASACMPARRWSATTTSVEP